MFSGRGGPVGELNPFGVKPPDAVHMASTRNTPRRFATIGIPQAEFGGPVPQPFLHLLKVATAFGEIFPLGLQLDPAFVEKFDLVGAKQQTLVNRDLLPGFLLFLDLAFELVDLAGVPCDLASGFIQLFLDILGERQGLPEFGKVEEKFLLAYHVRIDELDAPEARTSASQVRPLLPELLQRGFGPITLIPHPLPVITCHRRLPQP